MKKSRQFLQSPRQRDASDLALLRALLAGASQLGYRLDRISRGAQEVLSNSTTLARAAAALLPDGTVYRIRFIEPDFNVSAWADLRAGSNAFEDYRAQVPEGDAADNCRRPTDFEALCKRLDDASRVDQQPQINEVVNPKPRRKRPALKDAEPQS